MRSFKFLAFILFMTFSVNVASQSTSADTVYYKYELETTGDYSPKGDTLYNVYFVFSNEDIPKLNSLLILNDNQEKNISLSEKSMNEDPWFEKKAETLRVKIDKWANPSNCLVAGLNYKSENVVLIDEELAGRKSSKSIDTVIIPIKRTRPPREKEVVPTSL